METLLFFGDERSEDEDHQEGRGIGWSGSGSYQLPVHELQEGAVSQDPGVILDVLELDNQGV